MSASDRFCGNASPRRRRGRFVDERFAAPAGGRASTRSGPPRARPEKRARKGADAVGSGDLRQRHEADVVAVAPMALTRIAESRDDEHGALDRLAASVDSSGLARSSPCFAWSPSPAARGRISPFPAVEASDPPMPRSGGAGGPSEGRWRGSLTLAAGLVCCCGGAAAPLAGAAALASAAGAAAAAVVAAAGAAGVSSAMTVGGTMVTTVGSPLAPTGLQPSGRVRSETCTELWKSRPVRSIVSEYLGDVVRRRHDFYGAARD